MIKLLHALSARHKSRQFSTVVNGLVVIIVKPATLYPSIPKHLKPVGVADGEMSDVEVGSSDVVEISENMLDETVISDDVGVVEGSDEAVDETVISDDVGVAEGSNDVDEVMISDDVEVAEVSEDMLDETIISDDVEVAEISEDMVEGVEMEDDIEKSLNDDELEGVLVVIELVEEESGVEVEETLPELELAIEGMEVEELEVEQLDELCWKSKSWKLKNWTKCLLLALLEVEQLDVAALLGVVALLGVAALLKVVVLLEEEDTALHFPNPGWQPVPQYALELPQYEYWEQQSPYFPPVQVIPAGDAPYRFPQRPFVVTLALTVEEGGVEEAVRVEVLHLEVVEARTGATWSQVPNDDWQPVPQ
ncbi:hypothetical protein GMOD_00008537 [Pyrenophora seminiperda CCB06]|uniref:Uncharacterized protein n=1 Tax=Pyrenophora seminiperda CCB06 TaxID=1302712 RepID=A0A3M7M8U0_9PLEO|nr:hypothetical protein GMOD_00008537 [Pyrenophora seminiperda CCB06]